MQPTYTLWQRITSDTPAFFKKIQLFGLALAGLGTSLSQVQGIPAQVTTALISVGSAMAIIGQFAVAQYQPLNSQNNATKQ
ncbi:MAG: hypothetical protein ACXVAY_00775 [Mucilaginibacter sp.]